jgi:hypothetical protein
MMYGRFGAVLLCAALLWAVTACDDPSTVGVGVGPDSLQGGTPITLDVGAASQRIAPNPSVTGNGGSASLWRMLAGRVNDPLTGPLQANAYFDVQSPVAIPDTILNAPAESLQVELDLQPSYLHGDSTSTVTLALYEVENEMDAARATADQTFPATPIRDGSGAELTVTTAANNDSLVSFDLPTRWIEDNLEVLKDTTDSGEAFANAFHGFRVEARGGNAVLGFGRTGTTMEIRRIGADLSSQFQTQKQFTHIERTGAKPALSGRLVAVDGLGEGLTFSFDHDGPPLDTLAGAFVNRASILAPVDTNAWNETRPDNFVRPRGNIGYRTVASLADTASVSCGAVGVPALSDTTCAVPMVGQAAPASALTDLNVSLQIFRESLLTGPVFAGYRVEIAEGRPQQNTLSLGLPSTVPVVFYASDAASTDSTRLTLTVTPK